MLLQVKGLKTYEGFYIRAMFEKKDGTPATGQFGPFYESDSILLDKFIRMVNKSLTLQMPLNQQPDFIEWFNCKSTVKNFEVLANRVNLKGFYDTNDIRKTSIILSYTVVYYTDGKYFPVAVEDINQQSCFFKYN